jgi:hypothetical protein
VTLPHEMSLVVLFRFQDVIISNPDQVVDLKGKIRAMVRFGSLRRAFGGPEHDGETTSRHNVRVTLLR